MTRLLAVASSVVLLAAWLTLTAALPANAGARPCYSTTTATGMRYIVVGPAYNQPGRRQMAYRRVWGATLTYYTCRPR